MHKLGWVFVLIGLFGIGNRLQAATVDLPNYYRYQVGPNIWRTDVPLFTLRAWGDTVAFRLRSDAFARFVAESSFPDTMHFDLQTEFLRYDQAPTGHLWRGPYLTTDGDLDQIRMRAYRSQPRLEQIQLRLPFKPSHPRQP